MKHDLAGRSFPTTGLGIVSIALFKGQSTGAPYGYAVGGIEARIGVKNLSGNDSKDNFAFKCHRVNQPNNVYECYTINALCTNKVRHGTIITGGSDGKFVYWDIFERTRLKFSSACNMPITAMDTSADGKIFAYALGYDWTKKSKIFDIIRLNFKLPNELVSLTSCTIGETKNPEFLLTTSNNRFLTVSIDECEKENLEVELNGNITCVHETFAKHVTKLELLKKSVLYICLADKYIHMYDSRLNKCVQTLTDTKGCTDFYLGSQKRGNYVGYYLIVLLRKKFKIFELDNMKKKFELYIKEINLRENPKHFVLIDDIIFMTISNQIHLLNIKSRATMSLNSEIDFLNYIERDKFSQPSQLDKIHKCINFYNYNTCAVNVANLTYLVNLSGKHIDREPIIWKQIIYDLVCTDVYIIGLLESLIEIKSMQYTDVIIDLINISEFKLEKFIKIRADDYLNVTFQTAKSLYVLRENDPMVQIDHLIDKKLFNVALQVSSDISDDNCIERDRRILSKKACHFIYCGRYTESFKLYDELNVCPGQAIVLYEKFRTEHFVDFNGATIPSLIKNESTVKTAIYCLIDYLIEKRKPFLFNLPDNVMYYDIITGKEMTFNTNHLANFVDYTLLKCYLITQKHSITSLLRTRNNLDFDMTQQLLIEYELNEDLFVLYEKYNKHRLAIEEISTKYTGIKNSQIRSSRIIEYCRKLDNQNCEIIFQVAEDLMKDETTSNNILKLFIYGSKTENDIDVFRVITLLQTHQPENIIKYLKYVVFKLNNSDPIIHDKLVKLYSSTLSRLDSEDVEFETLALDYNNFLKYSKYYDPETALSLLPNDNIVDHKIIIYKRLNMHNDVLTLYVYHKHEYDGAEQYLKNLLTKIENEHGVSTLENINSISHTLTFSHLDKLCLHLIYLYLKKNQPVRAYKFITTLMEQDVYINISDTIEYIQNDVSIYEIRKFVTLVLNQIHLTNQKLKLLYSLMKLNLYKNHKKLFLLRSGRFVVDDKTKCIICMKKIGVNIFIVEKKNFFCHYYCYQKNFGSKHL
ncbi:hypothetical protein A3Q56_06656 [Intoshia linei]|uniref:CNH domain-containing protein n=1 Tax=Intoshia linei TaxID=1819745 RepID=A0A177AUC3_9BILA|nr:hypothetical protein A3Q56_06656 [Intoshia linei]